MYQGELSSQNFSSLDLGVTEELGNKQKNKTDIQAQIILL